MAAWVGRPVSPARSGSAVTIQVAALERAAAAGQASPGTVAAESTETQAVRVVEQVWPPQAEMLPEHVLRQAVGATPEPLLVLPVVEAVWSQLATSARSGPTSAAVARSGPASAAVVRIRMGLRLDATGQAVRDWVGAWRGAAVRPHRPGRPRSAHGLPVRAARRLRVLPARAPTATPEWPCWSWSAEAPSGPSPPQGLARNRWTGEQRGTAAREELGPPSPQRALAAVGP
jgi:hypothetical protein